MWFEFLSTSTKLGRGRERTNARLPDVRREGEARINRLVCDGSKVIWRYTSLPGTVICG